MASPDYAALWAELRLRVEGDAEYAKDEAHRASRGRHANIDDYNRLSGEAHALSRILAVMDEMAPEDRW
jgi:hypothetical protein